MSNSICAMNAEIKALCDF